MRNNFLSILIAATLVCGSSRAQEVAHHARLLIRCDDIGMCHTVNMAVERVLASGLPVSLSVMFACPWYQEAVDILKRYPGASIGVHLALNSEWRNYRWGPVAGAQAVPSLVDSNGYFFPSRAELFSHRPDIHDVERELRAQIERAKRSGLHIDYLDYHMGAAVETAELRTLVERLAREFDLGISRCFGENDVEGLYFAVPSAKLDTAITKVRELAAGSLNLLVFHIGMETPEMNALMDMNPNGLQHMSSYRQAELNALLSPDFLDAVRETGTDLTTYRDVIRELGLKNMHWQ